MNDLSRCDILLFLLYIYSINNAVQCKKQIYIGISINSTLLRLFFSYILWNLNFFFLYLVTQRKKNKYHRINVDSSFFFFFPCIYLVFCSHSFLCMFECICVIYSFICCREKRKRNFSFFDCIIYKTKKKQRCQQGHHFQVLSLLFFFFPFITNQRFL